MNLLLYLLTGFVSGIFIGVFITTCCMAKCKKEEYIDPEFTIVSINPPSYSMTEYPAPEYK